ncbi:MAG: zinc ABC transporter substrate-binding protein [Chlamydiia bacterium]|nr:zinc ABC transporter substrate-binding protein [Chlamydiia bacterium]
MRWLLGLLVLAACQTGQYDLKNWMQDDGKIKVLATVGMIGDLAKEIGGDEVDVIVLIKGDLDPHTYQLVKGDDEKLFRADVIFANGLGLEHGPNLNAHLSSSDKTCFLGSRLKEKYPDDIIRVDGQTDPHIWMDLSLYAKALPVITEALSKIRPEKKALFLERQEKLYSELMKGHETVRSIMQRVPSEKRYLVTSHDAFNYFAKAYLATSEELQENAWQKRFQAPEGLSPDSQLSQKDISDIVEHVKKYHIEVIFPESNVSPDSLKKIREAAREKGLEITLGNPYLYADAMGPKGSPGDTYLKMVISNAKTIAEDLMGETSGQK